MPPRMRRLMYFLYSCIVLPALRNTSTSTLPAIPEYMTVMTLLQAGMAMAAPQLVPVPAFARPTCGP